MLARYHELKSLISGLQETNSALAVAKPVGGKDKKDRGKKKAKGKESTKSKDRAEGSSYSKTRSEMSAASPSPVKIGRKDHLELSAVDESLLENQRSPREGRTPKNEDDMRRMDTPATQAAGLFKKMVGTIKILDEPSKRTGASIASVLADQ